MYIKINMGYLWDNYGITRPKMMHLRVQVVNPTCWHVEGVTTGSHHSSALLGLAFKASGSVQRAAISVRHHLR